MPATTQTLLPVLQARATWELLVVNRDLIELWIAILVPDWVAKTKTGFSCNSCTCLLPVLVIITAVLRMKEGNLSQW